METIVVKEEFAVFAIINLGGDTDDKILLVHDKDKPACTKKYKCPGGKRDNSETPEQTLYREVLKEEIVGLKIKSVSRQPFFEKKFDGHKVFFFTLKANESSDVKPGEEIEEIKTCTPDEVMAMIESDQILPTHAEALQKYLTECAIPF